ncbi:hypothetical protein AKJ16_DCAP00023 [Drosera capensis]
MGSVPFREFPSRESTRSLEQLNSSSGRRPENEFEDSFSSPNAGRVPNHSGIVPESWFPLRSIWDSFLHRESSTGTSPVSEFPEISNSANSVIKPNVAGIFPENLSRSGEFPSCGGISPSNALLVTSKERRELELHNAAMLPFNLLFERFTRIAEISDGRRDRTNQAIVIEIQISELNQLIQFTGYGSIESVVGQIKLLQRLALSNLSRDLAGELSFR